MKLVLDFDDFHWKEPENCLETIEQLVREVPNIKLSFFTVPKHSEYPIQANIPWCNKIRDLIKAGNIRLAYHGFTHSHLEFAQLKKQEALDRIKFATLYFDKAKLPIARVFKGPNWGINAEVYEALAELGFSHVYSHEDYKFIGHDKIKTVFYNWNLKDAEPPKEEIIIAHGHTHNVCENGIAEASSKIVKFIKENNPQLIYVDEV